ncbi:EAL domain-containing protein [Hoeflea sp.]|uniref:EAL domain-containing protein n=1 Tax=Hoeflea sp. TaxID=1940281 RepID=UPI003B52DF15
MAGRRKPHFLTDQAGFRSASYGPFILQSGFQPIFSQDAEGRLTIEAFEALIRPMSNGQRVSPGHFFSLVEPEDAVFVDTMCRELHILNMGKLGRKKARLFINFNPSLFHELAEIDDEADRMVSVAIEAGLRPSRIVCEITEQGSGDNSVLNRLVSSLRARMFKIAVDDFGADDSDIARVTELNPDILKFDAAWVRRFTETSAGMGLLKLMVERFTSQGITVLFEGLEEDHQVDFCSEIGVKLMQGYALARPEIVPTSFSERFPEFPDRPEPEAVYHAAPAANAEETGGLPRRSGNAAAPFRRAATFGKRTR